MSVQPLPSGALIEDLRRSLNYTLHEVSGSRVWATIDVDERHHQPYGRVHGGIFAIAVEGVASAGASAAVAERKQYAVGTSNTTDFLRPMVAGRLQVVAEPVFQGRTQQLWQVVITRDDNGKLIARGSLRLQNVPLEHMRSE